MSALYEQDIHTTAAGTFTPIWRAAVEWLLCSLNVIVKTAGKSNVARGEHMAIASCGWQIHSEFGRPALSRRYWAWLVCSGGARADNARSADPAECRLQSGWSPSISIHSQRVGQGAKFGPAVSINGRAVDAASVASWHRLPIGIALWH